MNKIIIILLIIFAAGNTLQAQKGYGTNTPDQQSIMDLTATNKGLLIPRVALTATNNISPFTTTPTTSMLVYNTASVGDVTPGFYYYNGTAWVKLSAAGDGSSLSFGSSPDYIQYNGTAGYFQYYGSNTIWDDLRISILTRTAGTPPNFTSGFGGSSNLYSYQFNGNSKTNVVYFEAQMPHSWAGTTIYPHVHWSPTTNGTGTVRWYFEYTWVNVNGTFDNATTHGTLALDGTAGGTAWVNLIAGSTGISPSASQSSISSLLVCRIYRDPTDGADTYADPAALIAIDIHFEKNTEGSKDPLNK